MAPLERFVCSSISFRLLGRKASEIMIVVKRNVLRGIPLKFCPETAKKQNDKTILRIKIADDMVYLV